MCCTDVSTGETLFQFRASAVARSVILEILSGSKRLRIQMERYATDWIASLKLPSGWCIYRFEVDGRIKWDRTAGKMKTQDGLPCNLALISTRFKPARKARILNRPL